MTTWWPTGWWSEGGVHKLGAGRTGVGGLHLIQSAALVTGVTFYRGRKVGVKLLLCFWDFGCLSPSAHPFPSPPITCSPCMATCYICIIYHLPTLVLHPVSLARTTA